MNLLLYLMIFINGSPLLYDVAMTSYFFDASSKRFIHGFCESPHIVQWLLSNQIDRELTSPDWLRRARVLQLLVVHKDPNDERLARWALRGYELDMDDNSSTWMRMDLLAFELVPIQARFITPETKVFFDDLFAYKIKIGDAIYPYPFGAICFIYRGDKSKLLPYFNKVDAISESDNARSAMYMVICMADVPGWRELFRERQKTETGENTQRFIQRALSDAEMLKRFAGYRKDAGYGDYISPEDAPWDDQVTPSEQSK